MSTDQKSQSVLASTDHCPVCEHDLDAATSVKGEKGIPGPGDIGICFYCASVHTFGPDLKRRRTLREEFRQLDPEQRIELRRLQIALIMRNPRISAVFGCQSEHQAQQIIREIEEGNPNYVGILVKKHKD